MGGTSMDEDTKRASKEILLHSCCAPCTIYPERWLSQSGWEITGYFYNPNIHPFTEFEKRLSAVRDFYHETGHPLIVDAEYDVESFMRRVFASNGKRCAECYRIRLLRTAEKAKEVGAAAFTSTLFYSAYQDHELARHIAREAAETFEIDFFYEDFRPGWDEGQKVSRESGMYRQKYCGCIISEQERYKKKIEKLSHIT
jgi:predicted adenine nucleotide alpha hydrolase (AANH) superfamily ATPase